MPISVCLQVVIHIERVGQCQDREDCIGSQSYRAEKTWVSRKIHVQHVSLVHKPFTNTCSVLEYVECNCIYYTDHVLILVSFFHLKKFVIII